MLLLAAAWAAACMSRTACNACVVRLSESRGFTLGKVAAAVGLPGLELAVRSCAVVPPPRKISPASTEETGAEARTVVSAPTEARANRSARR